MFTSNEQKLLHRLHTELPQAFRRGFVADMIFGLAVGGVLLLASGR